MPFRSKPEEPWHISYEAARNRFLKFPKLKTQMFVIASQMKLDLDTCSKDEFVAICELAWEKTGAK